MAGVSYNGHASNCMCVSCSKIRAKHARRVRLAPKRKKAEKKQLKPKLKIVRPWALGLNGHAQKCECDLCVRDRIKAFKTWFRDQEKLPAMPDPTKTVFVRPHWRRQYHHLNSMPLFKKALIKEFK